MDSTVENPLILKKLLYTGTKNVTFGNGTKVYFHFQTRLCDPERTIIDDSRKMGSGKPMELILGKKFKLEVWETMIQKMFLNEVAVFTVDKSLVFQYPFVSKTLRDAEKPQEERRSHCCGVTLQNQGIGYEDLNELIKNPSNLEFTLELLKVEYPNEYAKESWQMSDEEKLKSIPMLREKGNNEYKNKKYSDAELSYAQAIGLLEQLMLKEKPNDVEWLDLDKMKRPLLLNFAQCKLNQKEYYPVIEHCTTVLKTEPDNVKALFRRAKAHVGSWNPTEAENDFKKVMELDKTLIPTVKKELENLEKMKKIKETEDKAKFKNLF